MSVHHGVSFSEVLHEVSFLRYAHVALEAVLLNWLRSTASSAMYFTEEVTSHPFHMGGERHTHGKRETSLSSHVAC